MAGANSLCIKTVTALVIRLSRHAFNGVLLSNELNTNSASGLTATTLHQVSDIEYSSIDHFLTFYEKDGNIWNYSRTSPQ